MLPGLNAVNKVCPKPEAYGCWDVSRCPARAASQRLGHPQARTQVISQAWDLVTWCMTGPRQAGSEPLPTRVFRGQRDASSAGFAITHLPTRPTPTLNTWRAGRKLLTCPLGE